MRRSKAGRDAVLGASVIWVGEVGRVLPMPCDQIFSTSIAWTQPEEGEDVLLFKGEEVLETTRSLGSI